VLPAVAREDVDAARPEVRREFDVRRMVAHDERRREIDPVSRLGQAAEVRVGLPADAAVGALVGTAVDVSDRDARARQGRANSIVHPAGLVEAKQPLRHAALVRHDEEHETVREPTKRGDRLREEDGLRRIAQVPQVFQQRPIPVQEDGRPCHGGGL